MEIAVKNHRERAMRLVCGRAEDAAGRILDTLLPLARSGGFFPENNAPAEDGGTRQKFRKKLREGELNDKEIDIEFHCPRCKPGFLHRRAWKS